MGRTSKRNHGKPELLTSSVSQRPRENRYYKAGIYARLSSDQDEKKNESVETQVEIAKKFVADWNQNHPDKIEVIECYIDLGKTGSNFNREAFGGYTDNLFAMRYLKEQVHNIAPSVLDKVITINGTDYIQVHPTFLYESIWNCCKRKYKWDYYSKWTQLRG